ncbi:MAG: zf-HC2 domain-containing protein, partial [bacterium]
MTTRDGNPDFYECVDPSVGELISQYHEPDLDAALRRQLDRHLEICDACRWELELQNVMVAGLERGALTIHPGEQPADAHGHQHDRPVLARWLGGVGGLALAASLILVFFLAPSPPDGDLIQRTAGADFRFIRPVESEVVLGEQPQFSWPALPGASMYRITLRLVDGSILWADSTQTTSLRVPDRASIPTDSRIQAFLEPVPADLAPERGVSVSFRTGGFGSFLGYRLGAAPPWSRITGLLGGIL